MLLCVHEAIVVLAPCRNRTTKLPGVEIVYLRMCPSLVCGSLPAANLTSHIDGAAVTIKSISFFLCLINHGVQVAPTRRRPDAARQVGNRGSGVAAGLVGSTNGMAGYRTVCGSKICHGFLKNSLIKDSDHTPCAAPPSDNLTKQFNPWSSHIPKLYASPITSADSRYT